MQTELDIKREEIAEQMRVFEANGGTIKAAESMTLEQEIANIKNNSDFTKNQRRLQVIAVKKQHGRLNNG